MGKFKVGDKVQVIKNYDKHKAGEVGTITSTSLDITPYYRISGDKFGAPAEYFRKVEDKPMFKVGDKVKIIGNTNCSNNMIGDIGVIIEKHPSSLNTTWKVSVKDRMQYGNYTREYDMELVETVEYENEWHLNDGKVEIPGDADKLEKDGSVVAFRYRKVKPFEFGDILIGKCTDTEYRFIKYDNTGISKYKYATLLNSANSIVQGQNLDNYKLKTND